MLIFQYTKILIFVLNLKNAILPIDFAHVQVGIIVMLSQPFWTSTIRNVF